jgi:1,4-alpha-glucan branching enzyme
MAVGAARLLREAGLGYDGPLAMQEFAARLWRSQFDRITYHESHDEAGNAPGTTRTSMVAVNHAALVGATREFAEARRVACGTSVSAGTHVLHGRGDRRPEGHTYDNMSRSKENLLGERASTGAAMFRFYQTLSGCGAPPGPPLRQIDIVHVSDPSRVIAFTRRRPDRRPGRDLPEQSPFLDGYLIQTDPDRLLSGSGRKPSIAIPLSTAGPTSATWGCHPCRQRPAGW